MLMPHMQTGKTTRQLYMGNNHGLSCGLKTPGHTAQYRPSKQVTTALTSAPPTTPLKTLMQPTESWQHTHCTKPNPIYKDYILEAAARCQSTPREHSHVVVCVPLTDNRPAHKLITRRAVGV